MTDTFAKSARPPNTAIAWAAKDGIYVEIPAKEGPPYVTRYAKTMSGLQSALNILLEVPAASIIKPQDHPKVKRWKNELAKPEVRAEAASIVRNMLLKK